MQTIIHAIGDKHQLGISSINRLAGGDINDVLLLKCSSESFVLKLNLDAKYPGMFEAEAKGLELLASSNSFRTPKVHHWGTVDSYSYLLMEYIRSGDRRLDFWQNFAENLVRLHQTTADHFGLEYSNYIGSLPQRNEAFEDAAQFYVSERLHPQLKMASDHGYSFPGLEMALKNISEAIPREAPSLVHGDLWGGNYLVSSSGEPVLIDPAVAFASREMDIGMMLLFGGFSSEVYDRYNEMFPMAAGWEDRVPIWQLYYLLVHLNLFGSGYLSRVKDILRRYT